MAKRIFLMGGVSLASLFTAAAAQAQATDPQPPVEEATQIAPEAAEELAAQNPGDIVVTAQRRQASVQDVSATISVVTAEQLSQVGVNDSQNLQILVPGLLVSREVAMANQLFIRGVGNNILGIGSTNSVATYVDGVYMPVLQQTFQVFNDVERVEVLKGPQAVLYGRNATGGALLITSKAPRFNPEVSGDVSYGNYDAILARATATGPLVSDVVAGRLSLQFGDRDAYSINLPSRTGQDFERSFGIRGALLFKPAEQLSVTVAADYSRVTTGDFAKATNRDSWNYIATSPDQFTSKPRERFGNVDSRQPIRDRGIRATINWETGLGDITSVTSYRRFKSGPTSYDNDGVGVPLVGIAPGFELFYNGTILVSDQFYHETFLATPADKPIRAIIGANYFNEDTVNNNRNRIGLTYNYQDRFLDAEAYSAFADFNFDVADTLTLIAGIRYSRETKDFTLTPLTSNPATGAITGELPSVSNRDSWSQYTPRFGIEFRPNDDLMLYATATKGFKSGGFNESNPLNFFDPENIWAYEVGVKSQPSRTVTANFSAFYYDYTDLQVQQIILPTFARRITNAASAKIYGAEGELVVRPAQGVRLGANAAYLHSEYGDLFLCKDRFGPCTITVNGQTVLNPASNLNFKGNTLARAPRFSALLYADYNFQPSFATGRLSLHGEAAYRSRTYWTPYELEFESTDPFWLVNANVRYDFPGDQVYVSVFGQNLFNTLYESHIADTPSILGGVVGTPRYVHWGTPRTYGVRVGFSF